MVEPATPDSTGDLTRADLALARQALRQDWPIPPGVKARILQRLIDYLDRDNEEGATASDRQVVMAARTLHMFVALNIDQQKIDLDAKRIEGGHTGKGTLADIVGEAEKIALERLSKNTTDPNPGRLL